MFDAIIIGAGFSGLYQLHSLRNILNLNCHLFEKGEEIGGTWFWNKYPGARCDTESQAYCYFFDKEIYSKWNWTERYPDQPEIQSYLNFVARKLDLFKSISFSSQVIEMAFHDDFNIWEIKLSNGKFYQSKFIITAVGCLSKPYTPPIPGLENFKGKILHTAEWPKKEVEFKSKNVAVIGTGSSGVQIIPEIAKRANSLTVLQRTANFSIPARNHKLNNEKLNKHKKNFENLKTLTSNNRHGHPWKHSKIPANKSNLEECKKYLEKSWEYGGLSFRDVFSNTNFDDYANSVVCDFIKSKINNIVKNPSNLKTLIDLDYPFGAKRPALDTNYYQTFNQNNVKLINIKRSPIVECYKSGLVISESKLSFDMLIFATGFDAITGPLLDIKITGKNRKKLSSEWENEPNNYLGLQIPNFPNLFTITGPGSPSVLTNMPRAIEQHVNWITNCISYLLRNNKKTIEACPKFSKSWSKKVKLAAKETMFLKTKKSWYLGTNVEGKPVGFIPYCGGLDKYTKICKEIENNNYEGFLIKD